MARRPGASVDAEALQREYVARCSCLEVASIEARAGLPVIKRNAQLVLAWWQCSDVQFTAQWYDGARADANVALGDALPAVRSEDMQGE